MTYNDEMEVINESWETAKKLAELDIKKNEINNLIDGFNESTVEVELKDGNGIKYTVAKIEYGQTAGYR
ncbi:MAG: hypothetical protein E7167_01735 [Firmicutes bacterium]|nr:hypothetical protein [Bacillota bacterium]